MSKRDLEAIRAALRVLIHHGVITKDQAWELLFGAVSEPESKPEANTPDKPRALTKKEKTAVNRWFGQTLRYRTIISRGGIKVWCNKHNLPLQSVIDYGVESGRLLPRAAQARVDHDVFYLRSTEAAVRSHLKRDKTLEAKELSKLTGASRPSVYAILKRSPSWR